jgi:hypothetical protein
MFENLSKKPNEERELNAHCFSNNELIQQNPYHAELVTMELCQLAVVFQVNGPCYKSTTFQ